MSRILLAIRAFFRILFDRDTATQAALLLSGPSNAPADAKPSAPSNPAKPAEKAPAPTTASAKPAAPARSEALTLLATLQREARFVDFVQEPLAGYSDAQIGAAARDVHKHCAEVIERLFALRPVVSAAEGSQIDVPDDGAAATRFHLVGNVSGNSPRRGKLCHPGWEASQCQLPQWTGSKDAQRIVAPAEVELP